MPKILWCKIVFQHGSRVRDGSKDRNLKVQLHFEKRTQECRGSGHAKRSVSTEAATVGHARKVLALTQEDALCSNIEEALEALLDVLTLLSEVWLGRRIL